MIFLMLCTFTKQDFALLLLFFIIVMKSFVTHSKQFLYFAFGNPLIKKCKVCKDRENISENTPRVTPSTD